MTDARVAAVLTAKNEEGSLLEKYYRFAFVCSSSQTSLNRKEVNRDLFSRFLGCLIISKQWIVEYPAVLCNY